MVDIHQGFEKRDDATHRPAIVTQVSPRAAKGFTEKQQTCREWNFGKSGCPRMDSLVDVISQK